MKRLGILLRDLGASELNWRLLAQLNASRAEDLCVTLFFEEHLPPCIQPCAALMPLSEAWGFTGPCIATSLSTAQKLALMPGPKAKLLYVWDLEWLRLDHKPFAALRAAYTSTPVVARTAEHKRLIETLWQGKVVGLSPAAKLEELLECLSPTTKSSTSASNT